MKGEAIIKTHHGRDLAGDGTSEKCRSGRHDDCAAGRCRCPCLHGSIPSLTEAYEGREVHIELPSGGIARVDPEIQPETIAALDEMMRAVVKQVEREVFDSPVEKRKAIKLERGKPNDEITLAGITAGFVGRRGTSPNKPKPSSRRL